MKFTLFKAVSGTKQHTDAVKVDLMTEAQVFTDYEIMYKNTNKVIRTTIRNRDIKSLMNGNTTFVITHRLNETNKQNDVSFIIVSADWKTATISFREGKGAVTRTHKLKALRQSGRFLLDTTSKEVEVQKFDFDTTGMTELEISQKLRIMELEAALAAKDARIEMLESNSIVKVASILEKQIKNHGAVYEKLIETKFSDVEELEEDFVTRSITKNAMVFASLYDITLQAQSAEKVNMIELEEVFAQHKDEFFELIEEHYTDEEIDACSDKEIVCPNVSIR